MKIILASSSPSRKELVERLKISFEIFNPDVDESALPNESHIDLVKRLSEKKAQAGADCYPDALCIGSDAIASCHNEIFGKPNNFEAALEQLQRLQNQTVIFYTGICVIAPNMKNQTAMIATEVVFRALSEQKIINYLNKDKPFGCAGSFQSETLGSALIQSMKSTDPTAIMGLPLITLCEMLEIAGMGVI